MQPVDYSFCHGWGPFTNYPSVVQVTLFKDIHLIGRKCAMEALASHTTFTLAEARKIMAFVAYGSLLMML